MTPKRIFNDRSRIETYQRCHRQRWHEYHEGGTGIVPVRKPLPLAVGGSVHTGIEVPLREARREMTDFRSLEDRAVETALADFAQFNEALDLDATESAELLKPAGADLGVQLAASLGVTPEEAGVEAAAERILAARSAFDRYLYAEQCALVEAMVRAYVRRRLRPLLEQYEVLEVEREGEWLLSTLYPKCPSCGLVHEIPNDGYTQVYCRCGAQFDAMTLELWFMSRPDALLLERDSRQLYILSLKTAASWDVRKAKDAQRDMQGLSEGVEVERRLGDWWKRVHEIAPWAWQSDPYLEGINEATFNFLRDCKAPPRIMGIRYEYLLKGERWTDKDLTAALGIEARSQRSLLVRGYLNPGLTAGDEQWNYSWEYMKLDGSVSKLYWKSWRGAPVWEHMPVSKWIDLLDQSVEAVAEEGRAAGWSSKAQATGFTTEHPLDTVFIPPIIVYRNDDDLRDWIEQIEAQERKVAEDVARVDAASDEAEKRSLLNVLFQQTRRACEYPSTCPYASTPTQPGPCFGTDEARRDPLATGRYKPRVPNHPQEAEAKEARK